MTKEQLEAIFDRVRALPPEKQEEVAEIVEWLDTKDEEFFKVPDEAWPGIERGLAAIEAGQFATDAEVAAVFAKARRR